MSNTQEKHVSRLAQSKGYRLEKVGKGTHHGRFCLVNVAQGSRVASDVPGAGFSTNEVTRTMSGSSVGVTAAQP